MRRLPVFNWLNIQTANKKQVDGLYDENFQVIGIDPRLGDKRLVKVLIHEFLHYLSDTYPKLIQPMNEKQTWNYTKQILNLIKKL